MTKPQDNLQSLKKKFDAAIKAVSTPVQLAAVRSKFLGRQGEITMAFKLITTLPNEERGQYGAAVNALKQGCEQALKRVEADLTMSADLDLSAADLTMPIKLAQGAGHGHPTQLVLSDIYDVFLRLGFAIVDGPEVESDWYNFEVLNMPPDHPARDMQDTFYIQRDGEGPSLVPRTHTSAAQIRYMEAHTPPFKIIVPGKAYRNEDEDKTHSWSFYQVEGLVVGESVSMADLKGTLLHVMQSLLGEKIKIRFRPSFFPYTEPSVEVDIWYRDEWLEICGAGMVHPHVLARGGIDPERFSGFAFGFGPDRLAMQRFGLTDLRKLWRPQLLLSDQL